MRSAFDSVSRGLLLIALGIIFFLLNYGFLSWHLWSHVLDLWPLILILAGIGLLFNQRIPLSTILLIFLLSMVGYSIIVGDKPIPGRMSDNFHHSLEKTGPLTREALPLEVKLGD